MQFYICIYFLNLFLFLTKFHILKRHNYKFECNEQISSRVLGIGSLMNILSSFKVKDLPSVEDIKSNLSKALLKLKTRQYENGLNQKKKKKCIIAV